MQAAQELNIDISRYTRIVDEGADYVADNFAWESAGYYWETNRINEVIDNGGTIDDVSKLINKWDTGSFDQRKACYEKIVKSYEKANI